MQNQKGRNSMFTVCGSRGRWCANTADDRLLRRWWIAEKVKTKKSFLYHHVPWSGGRVYNDIKGHVSHTLKYTQPKFAGRQCVRVALCCRVTSQHIWLQLMVLHWTGMRQIVAEHADDNVWVMLELKIWFRWSLVLKLSLQPWQPHSWSRPWVCLFVG